MAEDPVDWLGGHIVAGVHLREAAWELRTAQAGEAWRRDAEAWRVTLRKGIAARNQRDVHKIDAVNKFPPLDLPLWHVWYEPEAVGIAVTSTGTGRPGNNPMSRHAALIERAEEIEDQWREAVPSKVSSGHVQRRGYVEADPPLIEEMHKVIMADRESITDAALRVCNRAKGKGTPVSKAKRLERRYIEKHGK